MTNDEEVQDPQPWSIGALDNLPEGVEADGLATIVDAEGIPIIVPTITDDGAFNYATAIRIVDCVNILRRISPETLSQWRSNGLVLECTDDRLEMIKDPELTTSHTK